MRTTTTLLAESTREQIVREYFEAFIAKDIDRIIQNIHPAIFYQRSINGRLEVSVNGIENFRNFATNQRSVLDEFTFEISKMNQDKYYNDRVEAVFSSIQYRANTRVKLTGSAVFWFTDKQIIQLAVEINSHA